MRIVVRGRQGGKTSEAIKWFLEHPGKRTIIVAHRLEAERVAREIEKAWSFECRDPAGPQHTSWRYWLDAENVVVFSRADSLGGAPFRGRRAPRELCYDDLDLILEMLAWGRPVMITLTEE